MARPRLHILNTDTPILKDGEDITVNCGIRLRNVKRAFTWDETEVGEMISAWPTNTCRQCCNLSDRQQNGRHFVYALRSGQCNEVVE